MARDLRHLVSDAPRIMVVDGSKLVRKLIGDVLRRELAQVDVVECGSLADARAALDSAPVDLVTTALVLPDGDGFQLAHTATVRWRRSFAATCSPNRSRMRACCMSKTAAPWRWRPSACWKRKACA
jgi:DNA-binding NtrC family response regulator